MSNIVCKSFILCFSKFKCLPTITFSPPSMNPDELEDEEEFYTCPTTKTNENNNNPSSLIIKNFNSLYDDEMNSHVNPISKSLTFSSTTTTTAAAAADFFSSSDYDSDTESIPDFSSAFASHRFFFSSPGSSNSIVEPPEVPPPPQDTNATVNGSVAVQTYSPDPYSDFRNSMVEMIESRDLTDVKADWKFLHELLLCYLTLNPKHTHKFIIGAFADVVVSLVSPPVDGTCRNTHHQQHCLATSRLPV